MRQSLRVVAGGVWLGLLSGFALLATFRIRRPSPAGELDQLALLGLMALALVGWPRYGRRG